MSQTDLNVANASGAAVRTDLNAHLDALVSQSSGASAPSTTFPNQWWLDTSTNILKQRDNANTSWVNTASKAGTNWIPYLNGVLINTVATESLAGIAEIATQVEADAGTDDTRIMTPLKFANTTNRLPRSYLAGLKLSNGTDATNDINIAVGIARSDVDDKNLTVATAIGKQIDASWAAGGTTGTPTGGLSSTLTLTDDTWYHVILGQVSGVEEVGFDTSITGATLVTDHSFTNTRRIGSVRRGTATNLGFSQVGDEFLLDSPLAQYSSTNPGTGAVTRTVTVPTGIVVEVLHSMAVEDTSPGGGIFYGLVTALDQTDVAPSQTINNFINTDTGARFAIQSNYRTRSNTSGQIRTRISESDATIVQYGTTFGWIDQRGRND